MYVETEYKWKKAVLDVCLKFYVITKICKMKTKEEIRARLEWITKRINWLEERLYKINPSKNIELFKKHSNEKWTLIMERERLLSDLDKLEWKKN